MPISKATVNRINIFAADEQMFRPFYCEYIYIYKVRKRGQLTIMSARFSKEN
jgi:hypothetical protein